MRTLETLRKMLKEEFGTGNGEGEKADGICQMADGICQMADGICQMADDGCEVRSGGCGDGESGEPTHQAPSEDGEPERSEPTQEVCPAPEKAQNEANPESTQSSLPLVVESSATMPAGRKRSQSAAGSTVPHAAGNDPFDPIAPAREGKERAWGTTSIK
jgi:hypothetical protein